MAPFLHKVGVFAFRRKWTVLIGWLVILVITAILAKTFMLPATGAITIPGLESAKALDKVSDTFSSNGKGSGQIVFATSDGKKVADYSSQITTLVNAVKKVDGVTGVTSPLDNAAAVSKDGTIAYASVSLKEANGSVEQDTFDGIDKAVGAARHGGLEVEEDANLVNQVPGEILGIGEVSGVVIALIVLFITLGSLVAAGLPLITAIIAIGVGITGLFAFSHLVTISTTTPVLAVMLGLAVGIDYSLFIISKYKNYLLEGYSYKDAAGKAIGTAGNAVIFAAATVVIALSALAVVNIPFMSTMGLAGAGTVALTAIVSVTLVPALLGMVGTKIFRGKTRRAIVAAQAQGVHDVQEANHRQFWYRWGAFITRHPVILLVSAVIVLGVIALPVRELKLGLPTDEYAAKTSSQRKAYDLLAQGFGAGFSGPLLVTVDQLPKVNDADRQAVRAQVEAEFQQKLAALPPAAQEQALAAAAPQINAQVAQYAPYYQLTQVANKIATVNNVDKVQAALVTDDGTYGVIQVIPKTSPSSEKTTDLITYLRDKDHDKALAGSAVVAVTGSSVLQNDVNARLAGALPEYLAIVVGLSLILLLLAFRSILVPLKATLGFLLSLAAMFGALVAVFQWGWLGVTDAPGPIISFIPIISIGVLFGLAMDYEFFLVSSIHESYQHEKDAKRAVINGFGLGSKVVTAAGFIMIAVFAGFISNHDATIQSIGFGLAVGIFLDAFLVRMTIVPAVLTLLGRAAWWLPKWLGRLLPNVSIEGEEDEAVTPIK